MGVPDRAIQQLVHEPAAPEPRPYHEADYRPRALVLDMRDRPRADQGAVGGLRRDRAPAGDLAIDVRQDAGTWFAGAQRAHVRDPAGHVEAGIAVRHAHASACAWLARHHKRREVIPLPCRRQHLDPHASQDRPAGRGRYRSRGITGAVHPTRSGFANAQEGFGYVVRGFDVDGDIVRACDEAREKMIRPLDHEMHVHRQFGAFVRCRDERRALHVP